MDGWETLESVVERDARESAVKGNHSECDLDR